LKLEACWGLLAPAFTFLTKKRIMNALKRIVGVLLIILITLHSVAQQPTTVNPFNNSFSLLLPLGCNEVTQAELTKLYPTGTPRPYKLYATIKRELAVYIYLTNKKGSVKQLIQNKAAVINEIKNTSNIQLIAGEERTINGSAFIICTFYKETPKGRLYNEMFVSCTNGTYFSGTISVPAKSAEELKDEMEAIVTSLKM
jgi:hypothetical protein